MVQSGQAGPLKHDSTARSEIATGISSSRPDAESSLVSDNVAHASSTPPTPSAGSLAHISDSSNGSVSATASQPPPPDPSLSPSQTTSHAAVESPGAAGARYFASLHASLPRSTEGSVKGATIGNVRGADGDHDLHVSSDSKASGTPHPHPGLVPVTASRSGEFANINEAADPDTSTTSTIGSSLSAGLERSFPSAADTSTSATLPVIASQPDASSETITITTPAPVTTLPRTTPESTSTNSTSTRSTPPISQSSSGTTTPNSSSSHSTRHPPQFHLDMPVPFYSRRSPQHTPSPQAHSSHSTDAPTYATPGSAHPSYSFPPTPAYPPTPSYPSSSHSNSHSHSHPNPLEIVLNTDRLIFRGVAGNLEPALLSGHVVLNLNEATNIRDVNLEFVGKARLRSSSGADRVNTANSIHPVIFKHSWSFLPDGGHKHTIKEGRHVFPFQLELSASLPASMFSPALSAEVYYKLRATAVKSSGGFSLISGLGSANWTVQRPVFLLKAFRRESLEYCQTLEVENTWPGKIMYSILIPHKAYAAGDAIPALLRFTPTAKGVTVLSIGMELTEYVSVRWNNKGAGGISENGTRSVGKAKFVIKDGRAVRDDKAHSSNHHEADGQAEAGPSGTNSGGTITPPAHSHHAESSTSGAGGGNKKFGQSSRSTSLKNLIGLGSSNTAGLHPHSSSSGSLSALSLHATNSANAIARGGMHHHGAIAADLHMSPASSTNVSRVPSTNALSSLASTSAAPPPVSVPSSSRRSTGARFDVGAPGPSSGTSTPANADSRRTSQEDVTATDPSPAPVASSSTPASATTLNEDEGAPSDDTALPQGDSEISTRISFKIPLTTVPSHNSHVSVSSAHSDSAAANTSYPLPLSVSHKVRFSVLMSNLDGHTSELRCALPVHILDARLLKEARAATRVTREVLLGRRRRRRGAGVVQVSAEQLGDAAPPSGFSIGGPNEFDEIDDDDQHARGEFEAAAHAHERREGEDDEVDEDEYDDYDAAEADYDDDDEEEAQVELPSYNSHVNDRLANAELDYSSGSAAVTGNSSSSGPSSYAPSGYFALPPSSGPPTSSGPGSPHWTHYSLPDSPRGGIVVPGSAPSSAHAQVAFSQELMSSLDQVAASRASGPSTSPRGSTPWAPMTSTSAPGGRTGRLGFWSTSSSRTQSRANSRAASPEPRPEDHSVASSEFGPSSRSDGQSGSSLSSHVRSHSYGHGLNLLHSSGSGSKSSSSLFHLPSSLKPLSALSGLRPHHHDHSSSSAAQSNAAASGRRTRSRPSSPTPEARAARFDNRAPSFGSTPRARPAVLPSDDPTTAESLPLPTYDEAERSSPGHQTTPPSTSPGSSPYGNGGASVGRSRSEVNLLGPQRRTVGHA